MKYHNYFFYQCLYCYIFCLLVDFSCTVAEWNHPMIGTQIYTSTVLHQVERRAVFLSLAVRSMT